MSSGGESSANNILVLGGPQTDIDMYKIAHGWKACLENTILPILIPIEKYCNIEYDDKKFLLMLTPNIFSNERANIPRTLLKFIKPVQLNAIIVLLSLSNYDVDYEPLTKHFISGLRNLPVLAIVLHGEETPEDIKQFQDKVNKTNLGKYITEMYSIGKNLEVCKVMSKKLFDSISNKTEIYDVYFKYPNNMLLYFMNDLLPLARQIHNLVSSSSNRIEYFPKIKSFRTNAVGCLDPVCREPQNVGNSILFFNPGVCHKFCKDNSAAIENCHIFQKDKCTICLHDISSHTKYFYKIDPIQIQCTPKFREEKTVIISAIATMLVFQAGVLKVVNTIDTTKKTGLELAEEMSKIEKVITMENVFSAIEKLYLMRSDRVQENLILSLIQKKFSTTNYRLQMFEVPITRTDLVKISDTLGTLKRKLDSFANSDILDQLQEVIGTIKKLREDASVPRLS